MPIYLMVPFLKIYQHTQKGTRQRKQDGECKTRVCFDNLWSKNTSSNFVVSEYALFVRWNVTQA